jgi:tRNA-splicing ligase RtcB
MFTVINHNNKPIKIWDKSGQIVMEPDAIEQLKRIAELPFVPQVAAMPDLHLGNGAAVGSVIPTLGAIIPAAVGVDIGCGMVAAKTSLKASDLPTSLKEIRSNIEKLVPHGRTNNGARGDRGAWSNPPREVENVWLNRLDADFQAIIKKHPKIAKSNNVSHLGTLGTGNHFVEICIDEEQNVWIMLHSGSRGIGNSIGQYFIEMAKQDMRKYFINLSDEELAYLPEGTNNFKDYVEGVEWAQGFAKANRELMLNAVIKALSISNGIKEFEIVGTVVDCHHNYISRESYGNKNYFVTRKGAVQVRKGRYGIIPGSMGAKSFIVAGKGNDDSFNSCSHGAGRKMSRNKAKQLFSVEDHRRATEGVECRKDEDVVDETPMAYKDIDTVIEAQSDLIEVVHTLKQIVCVKG